MLSTFSRQGGYHFLKNEWKSALTQQLRTGAADGAPLASEGGRKKMLNGKVLLLTQENKSVIGVGGFHGAHPPLPPRLPLITPSIQICPQFEIWLTGRKDRAIFVFFS